LDLKELPAVAYGAAVLAATIISREVIKTIKEWKKEENHEIETHRGEPHSQREAQFDRDPYRSIHDLYGGPVAHDTSPIRLDERVRGLQQKYDEMYQLWKDERSARHSLEKEVRNLEKKLIEAKVVSGITKRVVGDENDTEP